MGIVAEVNFSAVDIDVPGFHEVIAGSQGTELRCYEIPCIKRFEAPVQVFHLIWTMVSNHDRVSSFKAVSEAHSLAESAPDAP